MAPPTDPYGRLPAHFTAPGSSSFADFLGVAAPDLLPSRRELALELGADTVLDAGGSVTVADQSDADYQAWRESALEVAQAALIENAEAAGIAAEDYQAVIERYIELAAEVEESIGDEYEL